VFFTSTLDRGVTTIDGSGFFPLAFLLACILLTSFPLEIVGLIAD